VKAHCDAGLCSKPVWFTSRATLGHVLRLRSGMRTRDSPHHKCTGGDSQLLSSWSDEIDSAKSRLLYAMSAASDRVL
jgi:hypothetical protein